MIESTLKIFVFDEVHVNGPVEIKEPITFIERVFSVFRRTEVTPNLLARPPTSNLGAKNLVVSSWLTSAFFALSSFTTNKVYGN
jgi:hypothetical protein